MEPSSKLVTVTVNPAVDITLHLQSFEPGRVNSVERTRTSVGGKGINVAMTLADLGMDVVATGFLGQANQGPFEESFREKGIKDEFVRIPGRTRHNYKIADGASQRTTDLNCPGLCPSAEAMSRLGATIEAYCSPGSWFSLCGSVPDGVPHDIYARLANSIRAAGGHVLVDTSHQPLRSVLECAPDIVKPNRTEIEYLADRHLATPGEVVEVARSLQRGGVGLVVVSMGDEGALFVDESEALWARPPRVRASCTSGAGDAMVGGLLYSQLQRYDLQQCARFATALGTYAVTRTPGVPLDIARMASYCNEVTIDNMGGGRRRSPR